MIGIAGTHHAGYQKRGYDTALATQLDTGILGYCGIAEHRLELLYGSIEGEPYPAQIIAAARDLGATF
jgi:NAD(P)H dehydrogenase (quinone)